VSENPNTGPVKAHATTNAQHAINVAGRPVILDTDEANCVKARVNNPMRS
jgi:hypothetical protein